MTLTDAALQILSAARSGSLEATERPLQEFTDLIQNANPGPETPQVLSILQEARMAIHAQRAQIALSLQNMERSGLYANATQKISSSWDISG